MARPARGEQQAAVIARDLQVLELRRAGMTFDEIANEVGYSDRSNAYQAYKRGLARAFQQPAAEVRELEADRLDRLQLAVWARALRGDLAAVDRVLRISERRSRLLGLDHADGIAERQLQLEQEKVRLIAVAFGKALDAVELTPAQRESMTRVLLQELRVGAGTPPATPDVDQDLDEDDGPGQVVAGEVTG